MKRNSAPKFKEELKRWKELNLYQEYNIKDEYDFRIRYLCTNPYLIGVLDNPSKDLIYSTVKIHPNVIEIIDDKYIDHDLMQYVIKNSIHSSRFFINKLDYKQQNDILERYPNVIEYIDNPHYVQWFTAISKNCNTIQFHPNPSLDFQRMAIETKSATIGKIKNPNIDIVKRALYYDPSCFKKLSSKNETICLYLLTVTRSRAVIDMIPSSIRTKKSFQKELNKSILLDGPLI